MAETSIPKGRREDLRLLTGQGRYVADVPAAGMAHGVVVRSPHAHAAIRSIDTRAARAARGVLGVFTAADLAADGVPDFLCGVELPRPDGSKAHQAQRPVLARDHVRHTGEPVAFVVAETRAEAVAAAELVVVDYDERPVVASRAAATAKGATAVWPPAADNVAFVWRRGDRARTEAAIAGAAHVVRLASHVTRVNANSLEPRSALGLVGPDGRLVIHASHQSPHQLRGSLAGMLKVKPTDIRVLAHDVGGSFGMKSGIYPEEVLVVWAARRLGRPVRWIADRVEDFLADDHGRDMHVDAALALDANGRFLALTADFDVNIGAYLSGRSLFMLNNIGGIAGVYVIPAIAAGIRGVYTHSQTTAPYRGAGRPEATYAIERLIDLAAARLGADPFELRRTNLVPAAAMPYDTGFVFTYDCGEFEVNMVRAARIADRAGFAERKADALSRGKLRGLGMANPIEVAGGPFTRPGKDNAIVRIAADGAVTLVTGSMSVGQGHETAMSQLVGQRLGVAPEAIRFEFGDTDLLPSGRGNGGSSAMAVGGSAVAKVVDKVIARARSLAADRLEALAADIVFEAGRFSIVGTDRSITLTDIVRHAGGLTESDEYVPTGVTFPNGCHMCEVEVDPDTGTVEIVRYTVVEDLGTVVNAQLAHGQMHGGIAQGVGQALGECMVYDADTGQLLTASFMDYAMPRADDLCSVTIETRSVPTKVNPLGAKGVGEAGTVGALVAVINAVCDALAPLGITHLEMPASPDRVWEAISKAKAAKR